MKVAFMRFLHEVRKDT